MRWRQWQFKEAIEHLPETWKSVAVEQRTYDIELSKDYGYEFRRCGHPSVVGPQFPECPESAPTCVGAEVVLGKSTCTVVHSCKVGWSCKNSEDCGGQDICHNGLCNCLKDSHIGGCCSADGARCSFF
ncbi:hypothetical protein QR680_010930 [Steinernema hermaphroditum]|uniref:EB domain-containing protein n=1 Tax=Steinernema hermaphroditum TaxID=289476 RepID=A0AA39IT15_9BILA|nr:hypothetical protein QR680_010930 [Steinernema hermaphroditum]